MGRDSDNINKLEYNHLSEFDDRINIVEFQKSFLENVNNIVAYLENNKESVSIEFLNNYYLSDVVTLVNNKNKSINMISIDKEIKTRFITDEFINVVNEYISKDIKELNIPYQMVKKIDLKQFTNLEKLRINGKDYKLDRSILDKVIEETKLNSIYFNGEIDDEVKIDSIVEDGLCPKAKYKGLTIKPDYYDFDKKYIKIYNKEIYNNIDDILNFVKDEERYILTSRSREVSTHFL